MTKREGFALKKQLGIMFKGRTEHLSGPGKEPLQPLPLFYIVGNYLRSFNHLINESGNPSEDELKTAYFSFLDTLDPESEISYNELNLMQEDSLISGLYDDFMIAVTNQVGKSKFELLWAERLALLWAVNVWLNPDIIFSNDKDEMSLEHNYTFPKERFTADWSDVCLESIQLQSLSPLRSNKEMPWTLWQLSNVFITLRLSKAGIGIYAESGRINGKSINRLGGVVYLADYLLQIAWIELLHAISHDIRAKQCVVCGYVFPLYKQFNKKVCSEECRKVYDKQRRDSFGSEYFREAQKRSRKKRKNK